MSVRDARVYTCTIPDKLSCTRLQNYTIGAFLKSVSVSVSVSVPWKSRFTELEEMNKKNNHSSIYQPSVRRLHLAIQFAVADAHKYKPPT